MIDSFADNTANFKEEIPLENEDLFDTFKSSEKIKRKKDEAVCEQFNIHKV